LAAVLGTFVPPLALFAFGAPTAVVAAFALAAPFFSLVLLEGRLTAHHRAFPFTDRRRSARKSRKNRGETATSLCGNHLGVARFFR